MRECLAARLIIAAILLGMALPASAGVATDLAAIDARQEACIAKDGSNNGMKICTGDARTAADAMLNRVYTAAAARLKGGSGDATDDRETLKRLVASERAWIAYRDAECDLRGSQMLGGSGEGLIVVDCLFALTKQRVRDLDRQFSS